MYKLILGCAFYVLFLKPACAQRSYIEITSYHPEEKHYDDLRQLDSLFSTRTIIGIGEATHGTSEFTLMRHRIFEYLVKEHGFNTFILEADFGACQRVNRYIQGSDDTVKEALDEVRLWPWLTGEMTAFIEWMRAYNEGKSEQDQLTFTGCDIQLLPSNLHELKRELENLNSRYAFSVETYVDNTKLLTDTKRQGYLKELLDVIDTTYYQNINIKTLVKTIRQNLVYESKRGAIYEHLNYRDSCMATNIKAYLDIRPQSKALYFAHNGHVSKRQDITEAGENIRLAGWHLNRLLGDKYLAIGQEFNKGTFNAVSNNGRRLGPMELAESKENTLGSYLSSFGKESVFVMRNWVPDNIEQMHYVGAVFKEDKEPYAAELDAYDAFIFVHKTTQTELYFLNQRQ